MNFAIETCYLSADEFGDLTRARLDRTWCFLCWSTTTDFRSAHADEEIALPSLMHTQQGFSGFRQVLRYCESDNRFFPTKADHDLC